VILVEGELDVISSYQVGVKEVVAIKGSALTEGQLALIRRLTKTVYLALDADTAGQEAIRRAILLCEPSGMNLRVVQLTGGKDPDAIAQADRDKWKQLVGAAVSVYQFYIDLACRTYDPKTGLGLKQITEMVLPQLNLIENSVEQAYYVKQLAERLGIGAGVVERELIKGRAGISVKQFGTQTGEKEAEERMGRQERLERFTLRLLLHQEGSVREKLAQVEGEWFVEGYLRRALLKLKETAGEGDTVRVVLSRLGTAERQLLEAIYTEKQDWQEGEIEAAARQLSEAAARLELNYWHARQRAIVGEMATAEPEKLVALRAEQRKIQDVLKELEGE
jgi:DNA primase